MEIPTLIHNLISSHNESLFPNGLFPIHNLIELINNKGYNINIQDIFQIVQNDPSNFSLHLIHGLPMIKLNKILIQ